MATIKTTGTGSALRIITKTASGVQRVSCSCCEICCMYPADQLGADFTNDDLPDNLTVNGSSLSRAGSAYGNITNGVIFESGVWALYTDGNRSTSNCLILGDGNFTVGDNSVEDQFADTYTIIDSIGAFPVERISLCVWRSPEYEWCDDVGFGVGGDLYRGYLIYGLFPQGDSLTPTWSVVGNILGEECNINDLGEKEGLLNTPVGSYNSIGGGPGGMSVTE